MEYTYLTGCGVQVSKICLGTMTLGGQVDETNGVKAIRYAVEQGVNFIDTANMYTGGQSEIIVGKALAGCRDKVFLATKAGQKMRDGINGSGLSRSHLFKEIDDSLRRLGTDYVDFYYLHAPDTRTPIEETLAALDDLVRSGKVRYVGASNFAAWQMCEMHYAGTASYAARPSISQMVYNLITRGIEQELVPYLKAYGIGLVVYNPLAGGLLTEKYAEKTRLANTRMADNQTYVQRYWNEENLQAWDDINRIAREAGIGMVELAMRWLISTENVDSIITGFSSLEQLKQNLGAIDGGKLGHDTLAACDNVWRKLAGSRFQYNR